MKHFKNASRLSIQPRHNVKISRIPHIALSLKSYQSSDPLDINVTERLVNNNDSHQFGHHHSRQKSPSNYRSPNGSQASSYPAPLTHFILESLYICFQSSPAPHSSFFSSVESTAVRESVLELLIEGLQEQ
jgi:hypothetical protein